MTFPMKTVPWCGFLAFGALLGASTGCSNEITPQCAAISIPAIRLSVRNARTGAFIASGSTVIARLGARIDTVTTSLTSSDSAAILIGTAAGVYDLTVQRAGYADWFDQSVDVAPGVDGCHPMTVEVAASLDPVP